MKQGMKGQKPALPKTTVGGPAADSNDLALENLMDEFNMTAADLQDLEQS